MQNQSCHKSYPDVCFNGLTARAQDPVGPEEATNAASNGYPMVENKDQYFGYPVDKESPQYKAPLIRCTMLRGLYSKDLYS